jgi:tetratricopeptide (TPR) repeat protein
MGNRRGEGNHLGNLGIAYSHLGSPRKAIEYYGQALKISREVGDRRGEGNVLGNMGLAYSDLGKPRKAIEFLKQSLDIGKAIEDPRIIRLCEQKLKELEGFDE